MAQLRVAIVIPVLNEADNIGLLLDDCAAQEFVADEILVVDAGSRDGTRELVVARARDWSILVAVDEEGATPGRGRNVGIARATSSLIATLDGGSRIGPGWLGELLEAQAAGSEPRLSVGVAETDARSAFEEAAGWFTLRGYKPTHGPAVLGRAFRPAGRNGFCFLRETWRAAGGYREDLPWGEDKSFVRSLQDLGTEVVVAPAARVRWRPRSSLGEVFLQYERYGRGDAMAGIDRQNELITFALYALGAVLAAGALRGRRACAASLVVATAAYLGLFVVPASSKIGLRALAWLPAIRVTVDVAKMRGFITGTLAVRRRHLQDQRAARAASSDIASAL